ncbi:sialoadhesin-like [Dunckerocampus dactyliophorus]|uniref:sialoadhesin-like n=1 Tax=Dunckerocampus dactyliophorus TaxID=161453 RepID=UPI00240611F8|nr:sialoadhesin-like [Dunckerocampus dactyliophorus]XP_054645475.1 sialoadhesin-like [Dunckerocampus dactyliophorus]
MNIILMSSLFGVAAFVLPATASKEDLKVSVSVWPPGSEVFLEECVLLQCTVASNSTFVWRYRWFRHKPDTVQKTQENPRHMVSGGSYSITAVTWEDAGSYWCRAERSDSNGTVVLLSGPTTLSVSELLLPSLTLTPSTRHMFIGDTFTIRCPEPQTSSSSWVLRQTSPSHGTRTYDSKTAACSPLEGSIGAARSGTCVLSAARRHAGLYWCEDAEGRSKAVHITVSSGPVIMRTPAFAVPQGSSAVLSCHYWRGNHTKSTFFRNGIEMCTTSSSSPGRDIKLTIANVTEAHQGFYKCASQDRKLESAESWLSVRRHSLSADLSAGSNPGYWIGSCVCILFILVAIWLIHYFKYKMIYTQSCWTPSGEESPATALPATKQDVTEVQWDLSWMEMSNLLSHT